MKKIGREEIERYYDTTKSVKDNITIMSKNGFQVSKDTLYRYCKEKGIGTRSQKETVFEDAKELVDPALATKENQKKLCVDFVSDETTVAKATYGINLSKEPEVTDPVVEEKRTGVLSPENQKIVDRYLQWEGWQSDEAPFPW